MAGKNPVKFTDTTFRDGHQSLLATRMRTEDIIPFMTRMDEMGYFALEVWGGATFDTAHRFLGDDPWDRIRLVKGILKKTPTMMLLRGQNLVGYRNYADDVTYRFVRYAAEAGVDIFRVFDALNDRRNWEVAVKALMDAKKEGLMAHFQAAVCYSLTQRRMGGPIFNLEYYIKFAKECEDMGADSVVLKDMAGMCSPYDAYEIIKGMKETIKIPVEFHTHYTSGSGSMSYLKAIEAGVDILDTCLSPFALRTAQPAIEPLVVAVEGTDRETDMDLAKLIEIGYDLEKVAVKYRDLLDTSKMAQIDTGVLLHQIPGGMYSNLVNQLKELNALDRIHEVMAELPNTRRELGYPPLVTPTSQIVGIQAVMNVLFGRYKQVTAETKGLAFGLYGKTPAPLDPEVQKTVLKGYERGEEPTTKRPGDILEPEWDKAVEDTKGIAKNDGDVLIYALYPTTGMRFLKWKYGLEPVPEEVKGKSLEQIKLEDDVYLTIKKKNLFAKVKEYLDNLEKPLPDKGPGLRTFNVFVDNQYYEVEVECTSGAPVITGIAPMAAPAAAPKPAPAAKPAAAPAAKPAAAAPAAESLGAGEVPLRAPMPGMVISYQVKVGDTVKTGDPVCILEAMKMQNSLNAPASGTVKSINFEPGASVAKDAILLVIAK
ncbi:MAG: pyruvate carboxylase subunit B [Desulfobacca sp.]|uniref:pyruvate carboxylase subunit B n=1 Tax=Desulfobacca sp. TaxID=2067990 RepID=UPI00404A4789